MFWLFKYSFSLAKQPTNDWQINNQKEEKRTYAFNDNLYGAKNDRPRLFAL